VVKLLLDKDSVNPESQDSYGQTSLLVAAGNGHLPVVKLLLTRASVKPDSEDTFGRTALSRATASGYSDIATLILESYIKYEIIVPDCDLDVTSPPVSEQESRIQCDICISWILNVNIHYHCGICHNGNFDLCQECITSGAMCLHDSHILVKRMIKNGRIMEVPE
jgi:hypothetical protein